MNRRSHAQPHGQIRRSQIITTFGPGAPLDLPNYSVLVGGLDTWSKALEHIYEPRLVEKLKLILGLPQLKLYSPPVESEDPTAPPTGITAWQFPEWFITQDVEETEARGVVRSRLLVHRTALVRGKFIDRDKNKRPVVPIRFVRACRRGHIGDIDWHKFVHFGTGACKRPLYIDERGTSGDLSEVVVRCECGATREINEATLTHMKPLGTCDGARPWLGQFAKESCTETNRLLVRSASNAYFPQIMRVISLPDRDEALIHAVNQVWENFLEYVETIGELRYERERKPPVKNVLEGFSDEDVYGEIQVRKKGDERSEKSVKQTEIETLMASKDQLGEDRPQGDFYARALPREKWDCDVTQSIDRVVLVHRLREVIAQVGFTRFESIAPDVDGELEMGVERASLSKEDPSWLPAVENRGEGIFLAFKNARIETWLDKPAVRQRAAQLEAGFNAWKIDHNASNRVFIGLPYIMLHSLSHLLITAVSLECGYPASSITERIYAGTYGYGILLYTQSPDAEGTLGGLVEMGKHIAKHLENALELGKLCSYDPVCAQHDPANPHERRFLHGAACHGCLLVAEPSCEQHNDFLDRALVVPTVERLGTEFFTV